MRAGAPQDAPVQVQPVRVGVDFDGHAARPRLGKDRFEVDGVRVAREEQAPRRVAEDGE